MDFFAHRSSAVVVDDNAVVRDWLASHLAAAGFSVTEYADGLEAVRGVQEHTFDLIVLDLLLPGLDGLSVCRAIRAGGPNSDRPVLMITARDAEHDRVAVLDAGADDVLVKPFGISELLARIAAVTRRHARSRAPDGGDERVFGALVINADKRTVTLSGEHVALTRREFDVLQRLAARPGVVLTRDALVQAAWPDTAAVTTRTVDAVISRLRQKIEADPRNPSQLVTVRGIGYTFHN